MSLRGGDIVVRALEDEGVRWTFGIPGTHNIELYDSLERSERITPVLVTDEQSASFLADGVNRASGEVAVVNVVPGAGVTHALSGVAEAYLDNIPMVVLTCGMRNDTGRAYQLHDIDQIAILRPVTKAALRVAKHADIYGAIRRAFGIARSGTPGPVAAEIPANLYFLTGDPGSMEFRVAPPAPPRASRAELESAVERLGRARHPALYLGYGARTAGSAVVELAERLGAPVVTTIQGKGVFPEHHPLWLWNGFGTSAPPFVRRILDRCDVLLAVGCRFGEVATASYGLTPPENLIHVDINREVFHRNYRAALAIESEGGFFVNDLLSVFGAGRDGAGLREEIAAGHRRLCEDRAADPSEGRVTPSAFFEALQQVAGPEAIYVADSGNGLFLGMEHLRLDAPGRFLAPVDYSCMGYSVPAAIGAKLAQPERPVVALTGDGALLMTGLELLTAATYGVAPVVCVLRDGELGQIVQFQRTSLDRDPCGTLPPYRVEDYARLVNATYLSLPDDRSLPGILGEALEGSRSGKPVVVEVAIDYSKPTFFTKGVLRTNFGRLPFGDRMRVVGRLVGRRLASAFSTRG